MENNNFSKNFLSAVIFTVLGLLTIKYFNISYPIKVVNTTQSSELAVVGEGKIDVTPDTAYVTTGISVSKIATISEVQKQIDTTNNKIISSLRQIGVDKADIKTSNYSINPNYVYENTGNKVDGYNGDVSIEVKIKNPQMIAKAIEAVTGAGANQVTSSRFVVDKPELYREQVRNVAIKNAKDQAQKLAKTLGISLGKITNIVESSPDSNIMSYSKALPVSGGGMGLGVAPVIEQGSQTLTSVVTLYFEKK